MRPSRRRGIGLHIHSRLFGRAASVVSMVAIYDDLLSWSLPCPRRTSSVIGGWGVAHCQSLTVTVNGVDSQA